VKREDVAARALPDCAGRRFAIVCARFHGDLADQLVERAMRALRDCNVSEGSISLFEVPGCFEIPLACRKLADAGGFDAVVALGAVIRGETPHFDFVAGECARGIMQVQLATGMPIGFGVLTTDNHAQAQERTRADGGDKGYQAAVATALLLQELTRLGRI
jgi:6,7-dimethyl-8-ribityllumazine synthase